MTPTRPACDIAALADDAWLLRFGDTLDSATNDHVHAIAARIREIAPNWLRDLVPAFASLGVFFDPEVDPLQVHAELASIVASGDAAPAAQREGVPMESTFLESIHANAVVEIPVAYGGQYGPDLESAAQELGISAAELAKRHCDGQYTVAMIGFAPGFPYLTGLDPALALPRLATPRARVAAGSVAIGGAQTGIYPRESPGGWRILGRTPCVLFDPQREPPTLLQPGDRVRFVAIATDEFPKDGHE